MRPTKQTTYSVRWGGNGDHAAAETPVLVEVRVAIRTRVAGNYSRSGVYKLFRRGRAVTQIATVLPNHAGLLIEFDAQRLRNGRWRPFAGANFKIGPGGSARAYLLGLPPGTYRVRNFFEGHLVDRDHLGNVSAWAYFKVTR